MGFIQFTLASNKMHCYIRAEEIITFLSTTDNNGMPITKIYTSDRSYTAVTETVSQVLCAIAIENENEKFYKFIDEKQTNGDLINRTDLLNAIWQKVYGKDYDGVNMLNTPHIDIIESLPTYAPTFKPIAEIKIDSEEVTKKVLEKIKNGEWIIESDFSKAKQTDSVLKDIKAEIDDLERFYDNDRFSTNGEPMFKVYEVLEIIDKYISGKENE